MKTTKKIITTGTSLCIVIDKPILEKLRLKKGDLVEIEIKKVG
jgi:antitoxin component of MazEF toxin-antitoxin module